MIIDFKYLPNATKMSRIENGNWIDCYSYQEYDLRAGDFALINLGFACRVPDGYDGILAPRSSTFKKYGLIQANSIGVIDSSYSGDDDIWMMPVYATRDVHIDKDTRLCQFRFIKQDHFDINEVEHLNDQSRGGFGTTGD